MRAVIFGAGNVGRGFLGLEMQVRGYEVTFVDQDHEIIDRLGRVGVYEVLFFDRDRRASVQVKNALHTSERDAVQDAVQRADVILTAVGAGNLRDVAPHIASGIQNAREQVIVACENAPRGTELLQRFVGESIPHPAQYAEFANCVIDRICLRQGDAIIVEPTFEWIVETRSPLLTGIVQTDDVTPYMTRKLFLVNCAHAIIGYAGIQRNVRYVHEALEERDLSCLVEGALEESCFGLSKEYGFGLQSLGEYVGNLRQRFSNPAIKDEVSRLVRDPERKLQKGERLLGPAALSYKHGLRPTQLCRGIAYALLYARAEEVHANPGSNAAKRLHERLSSLTGADGELLDMITAAFDSLQQSREKGSGNCRC